MPYTAKSPISRSGGSASRGCTGTPDWCALWAVLQDRVHDPRGKTDQYQQIPGAIQ